MGNLDAIIRFIGDQSTRPLGEIKAESRVGHSVPTKSLFDDYKCNSMLRTCHLLGQNGITSSQETSVQIIIYLNPALTAGQWLTLPASTQAQASINQGSVADLLQTLDANSTADVYVVIPGTLVTHHHVQLPASLRAAKLRQAIPYALEEKLSANIDDCHFAFPPQAEATNLPVAVVNKQTMQTILSQFNAPQLRLKMVCPDYLAISLPETGWYVVGTGDQVICRSGQYAGFSIDQSIFNDFFPVHVAASEPKPSRVEFSGVEGHAPWVQAIAPIEVVEQTQPIDLLSKFSDSLQQRNTLNLCQGEFQQKMSSGGANRQIKLALTTVATILLTLVVGQLGQTVYFNKQLNQLDAQIASVYKKAYPDATRVTAPKTRIENEIKSLGANPQSEMFLSLLKQVGTVLNRDVDLQQVQFDRQQMQLRFKIASFEKLEQLTEQWQTNGLQVKQDQASSESDGVMVAMTISQANG